MIEIITDIAQLSPEWFTLRCGSLGSSSVKNAMAGGAGKSRKTLACQLVAESITNEKTQITQTPAMLRGMELEPEARDQFSFITGLDVEEVGMIKNTETLGCHASPDGLCSDGNGLEIKCPNPSTHIKYLYENRLPVEYVAQVQFSMWVSGLKGWWFVSYHPQIKPLHLLVKRDDKYIDAMSQKVERFMAEMEEISTSIAGF